MLRTERLAASPNRNGMLAQVPPPAPALEADAPYAFTAEIEVRPRYELPSIEGLELPEVTLEVTVRSLVVELQRLHRQYYKGNKIAVADLEKIIEIDPDNAEAWLSEHAEDPDLLRCLGRLATREQLWSHARDYFERSAAARPSAETYAELGRLLAAMGDAKASAGCFNQALALVSTPLPALPMPEKPLPRSHRLSNQS